MQDTALLAHLGGMLQGTSQSLTGKLSSTGDAVMGSLGDIKGAGAAEGVLKGAPPHTELFSSPPPPPPPLCLRALAPRVGPRRALIAARGGGAQARGPWRAAW